MYSFFLFHDRDLQLRRHGTDAPAQFFIRDGDKGLVILFPDTDALFLVFIVTDHDDIHMVFPCIAQQILGALVKDVLQDILPLPGQGIQGMALLMGVFTVRAPGKGKKQMCLPFIEPLVQGLYRASADDERGVPEVPGSRKQVVQPDVHAQDPCRVFRDRGFLKLVIKGHQDTEASVGRLHLCFNIGQSFIEGSLTDTERLLLVHKTQVCFPSREGKLCRLVGPPGSGTGSADITENARF